MCLTSNTIYRLVLDSDSEDITTEEFNRRQDLAAAMEDARADAREAAMAGVMRFVDDKAKTNDSDEGDDEVTETADDNGDEDADDEADDVGDDDEVGKEDGESDDDDEDDDDEDDEGDDDDEGDESDEGDEEEDADDGDEDDDEGDEEKKDACDDDENDIDTGDMADEAEFCIDLDYLRHTIRRLRNRLGERDRTVMDLKRTMNKCETCREHAHDAIIIDLCSTTDDDGDNGDPFKTPERRPSKTYVPRAP